jgi:hypothetical protein
MLDGALFLEDHSREIKKHLVPLHFELASFVQLRIPEPNSAELQVTGEHFLIVTCETRVRLLVDHLQREEDCTRNSGTVDQNATLQINFTAHRKTSDQTIRRIGGGGETRYCS